MLSLTRKTDYALLALTHLAAEPAAVISAREMAEQYCLSQPLLMNVLKQLSASGLVSSVRGARGGYTLAKSAEQITLAELIGVIEGPVRLAPCVGHAADGVTYGLCNVENSCPIQSQLTWLHGQLRSFLEKITLAELASAGGKLSAARGQLEKGEAH